MQETGIKTRVKRLDAQAGQQGVLSDITLDSVMPKHCAETPRIVQAKSGVLKHPFDMVMLAQELTGLHAADGS